ncbi:MAG: threonine/serine dehydratase [Betaproteobacteria bacterium]|nr:MAG: threonine/serine dehydratase [Betaproteobacteria bacterium]
MFERLTPESVIAAAARIAPHIKRTRLLRSESLSVIAQGDVYLKLENEQITGSFKLRGALNALATLDDDQRARGVVASSAGNHGMGVAYAARTLGMRAKIYVPRTAPSVKKAGIRSLGAELDDSEPDYDAAMARAKDDGRKTHREFINPCLGEQLLAGQGTVALEILEDLPGVRSLVVNVGGGGLLGGCASYVRHRAGHVRIYGAQSVNTAAMSKSLAARHLVEIESRATLADGLAGQIDEDALDIGTHALDGIVMLSEDEIARAIAWLHRELELKVEGAGACGVGAVLFQKLRPETPCAIVVSGGNIDDARWREILEME